MRHRKSGRKLGRTASHRAATLANMATSLFEHKRIKTTSAKAKELRGYSEALITFAKRGDLHARRMVMRTIHDKAVVKELFEEIAPTFSSRTGGYTRIIKLGRRLGDGAEVSFIELVGFEAGAKATAVKSKKDKKAEKVETEETVETTVEAVEPVAEEAPKEEAKAE